MTLFQCFVCPVIRKPTVVENHDFVGIHANLYGNLAGIILVHNGVEYSLTQGIFGERITLNSVDAVVGNAGFQILLHDDVDGFVGLLQQRTMHFVHIKDVGIIFEKGDFYIRAANITFRILGEEKGCRSCPEPVFV